MINEEEYNRLLKKVDILENTINTIEAKQTVVEAKTKPPTIYHNNFKEGGIERLKITQEREEENGETINFSIK